MSEGDYLDGVLGNALRELSPLVEAAVQALDKPGARALRRKLDRSYGFAVLIYGAKRGCGLSESERLSLDLPRYGRATTVRPVVQRQKGQLLTAPSAPMPTATRCLQLVVDNTSSARVPPHAPPFDGDAA